MTGYGWGTVCPAPLLFVLLLSLPGCGDPSPVFVAAPGDWDRAASEGLRRGIELARDEVNGEGGIGGRPLELVFSQVGRTDVAAAVRAAREIVDDDRIVAVVGHPGSASAAGAVPIYWGAIPAVLPLSTSRAWSQFPPWAFQVAPRPSDYTDAVGRLVEAEGWSRVAIVFDNTPGGRSSAERFRDVVDPDLFQPVYTEETVGSYRPIVEVMGRREIDAVLLVTAARNSAVLLPLIDSLTPDVAVVAADPRDVVPEEVARGVYLVERWDPDSHSMGLEQSFVDRYSDAYGELPSVVSALGYDAVSVVAEAMRQAGPSRAAIRAWLGALGPSDPLLQATGPLAFDSTGVRASQQLSVWRVCRDGEVVRGRRCS